MTLFSKQLIQAVSDWQMASNTARGAILKSEALLLPPQFRSIDVTCYRRLDLNDPSLRRLGTDVQLTEKVSSWTLEASVAQQFSKGIPSDPNYQGLIFSIDPSSIKPPSSVILDFTHLFSDEDFLKSVEQHRADITDFDLGMGKWWNSEKEVIIELDVLSLGSLRFWGGYSSSEDVIITKFLAALNRPNNPINRDTAKRLMRANGIVPGPWWLSNPDGLKRAAAKLMSLCAARSAP